ncbi:MAG: T9SS type A sorting domain-containing protein [Ignavibacteriaceae bacterium]|nr:T9SS type A sorting domain-containing protein [Ignavibacteriaceae bacterium]
MKLHSATLFIVFVLSYSAPAQVRFDANFPSGNINTVTTTDSITYNVTTKTDIGGRWFYFRITGVKNRLIRVKVTSSDVKRAVYSYDDVLWIRFTAAESPATNTFEKTYERDTVFVAYYDPYTYAKLQGKLADWLTKPGTTLDTLGYTLNNYPLQELTITDPSVPASEKLRVWIHARTHPSETPTSFHFEGIINELLKDEPVVNYYKSKVIFHCVPFTNPDGVYFGRSRTNFYGVDVESDWDRPDAQTSKEVLVLKARMRQINQQKVMSVFLNLHSQASPFATFWIHTAASTSAYFYRREMQFCNLNISDNPYFVASDYSFSSLQPKFPEGWLWNNHGEQVMALTYETPYDFYSMGTLVTNENLYYLGERTLYSVGEYLKLDHPERFIADNNQSFSSWNSDTTGYNFYNNDFLWTYTNLNKGDVQFGTASLKAGKYKVSAMWPGATVNATNTKMTASWSGGSVSKIVNQQSGSGIWNELFEINLLNESAVSITVSDSANGRIVADAFRFVYDGPASGIEDELNNRTFTLYNNYPNPFNPVTTIRYSLTEPAKVQLLVYNSIGELVSVVVNEVKSAGTHSVQYSAVGLASGVYYYRLLASGKSETRAMILLK